MSIVQPALNILSVMIPIPGGSTCDKLTFKTNQCKFSDFLCFSDLDGNGQVVCRMALGLHSYEFHLITCTFPLVWHRIKLSHGVHISDVPTTQAASPPRDAMMLLGIHWKHRRPAVGCISSVRMHFNKAATAVLSQDTLAQ